MANIALSRSIPPHGQVIAQLWVTIGISRPAHGRSFQRLPEQGRYLRLVLNGFYNYYAVPTNFRALNSFSWHIMRYWQHCLRRRSQRHRLTCQRMMRIAAHWLPSPETPALLSRLAVRRHDPRWEPGAVVPLVGICAGGGE